MNGKRKGKNLRPSVKNEKDEEKVEHLNKLMAKRTKRRERGR